MAVYKNKDGRTYHFRGKIRLPNGEIKYYKQTKVKYSKKKDASEAENLYRKSLSTSSNKDITMDELYEIYLSKWTTLGISPSTMYDKMSYYKNHIHDYFGKMKLKDITPPIIEDWKVYMTKKRQKNGSPYSERTINSCLEKLSGFLTFAVKMGYIESNPRHNVSKLRSLKEEDPFAKEENFWELDEYNEFIECVDDPYWHDVFEFMYQTGVREGELFALTWNNVDFHRKKIRIRHSITPKTMDRNKAILVKEPKNKNSYREIDMSKALYNILKKRFKDCRLLDGFTLDYYVFGDIKPLSRSTLARHLDKYINISAVTRITPHGFRHSHASLLIKERVDDNLIAERLGHTVTELRRTYAHIYNSSREELINKLDSIFE